MSSWTSFTNITKDLEYMDQGKDYSKYPELLTGGGRGIKKSQGSSRSPGKSPLRPGLLDRNGELIEFDEEELSRFEDAPIEDELPRRKPPPIDPKENERGLKLQMRMALGNPMANDQIEKFVQEKAKESSPKPWHSTGSDSSSSFQAASLDASSQKKKHHRKRESKEFKAEDKKLSEAKSPVEKKKSNQVLNPRDRASRNALISNLLKNLELPPKEKEIEPEKYVPPYRRSPKNEKEEKCVTSDEDVIVEDDFEDLATSFENPEELVIKTSENVLKETDYEINQFKKKYLVSFVENNADEEKNLGKKTVASMQTNKMELNNNVPSEKDIKYENLGKKILQNKNAPKKKVAGGGVYDFEKFEKPYATGKQNSTNVSYFFKKENEKKEFNLNAREFPSL